MHVLLKIIFHVWYPFNVYFIDQFSIGKTTIFKILTGDITSTSETSVLAGYDIRYFTLDIRLIQEHLLVHLTNSNNESPC